MRKWKRQARGAVQQSGNNHQQGTAEKKRKIHMDDLGHGAKELRKKSRKGVNHVTKSFKEVAVAVEQPRHAQ